MPYKDKDKQKEYQRQWYQENKENLLKKQRKRRRESRKNDLIYNRKLRRRVIEKLGSKCVYCGCDISEALEINHIKGGGREEVRQGRSSGQGYYLNILTGRRSTDDLELTCRVCNNWHYLVQIKGIPDGWTIMWDKPKDLYRGIT